MHLRSNTMNNKPVSDKLMLIAIVVSMFLWGLGWPSAKVLTHYASVVNLGVYRYIIVVASLFLLLIFSRQRLTIKKAGIPFVVAAGVLLAAYSYLFFMGLKNGSPGAGGVLVTTLNPIMAYVLGALIDRKLPSKNEAIGLALGSLAGVILLRLWSSTSILDSGNIYFLFSAVLWAAMSKFTSKGTRYGTSTGFSLWQYVITLACLLPLVDFNEFSAVLSISYHAFWFNLFFGAIMVTTVATTMYFYATTRLGAEKASSFIFLVPLAAAVSSWLFLGERILIHTIVGGILGMAAVYMINRKPKIVGR